MQLQHRSVPQAYGIASGSQAQQVLCDMQAAALTGSMLVLWDGLVIVKSRAAAGLACPRATANTINKEFKCPPIIAASTVSPRSLLAVDSVKFPSDRTASMGCVLPGRLLKQCVDVT
jgi:hypothetical protein